MKQSYCRVTKLGRYLVHIKAMIHSFLGTFLLQLFSVGCEGTPHINCFEVGSQNGRSKHHQTGIELKTLSCKTTDETDTQKENQLTTSIHVYDFPNVEDEAYDNYEQEGQHSNECPGHYHLATQYEIPVAAYEHPRVQSTSHVYKNTLLSDLYVPTLVYILFIISV